MIIRRRSAAGLLCMLAALATLGAPPASAARATAKEPPKVELVLDVSGSMRARDIDGRSRISVAQQSFNDVVDALPAETQLGIRVLGSRHRYPGSPKSVGCRDTEQISPVATVDKGEAKAAIATLRPTGWTPIGLALRAAAKDLGAGETTRRIVLITDGEDTCAPPDPCDVARELAAQGTHLVIDTLGLSLDDKVRRQLTCIAGATGGTYTAVQHQQQLTNRLNQLVHRAGSTYQQTPQQVAGGAQCVNAPVLSPGVYTDRERFGEHRVYRVPVAPGQELRASVSVGLDRSLNPDYGVLLRATSQDGQELVRGTDAGSGRTDVLSTGLRWSDQRPATASEQPSASPSTAASATGTVCLVVSNSFSAPPAVRTAPGMPLELTVDVVPSSPTPNGPDLGRGWLLLVVLTVAGLVAGLVFGWLARWRIAIWKEN
ncbi:VWA domain-containing protein [Actinoallomurus purpureus]|uniref:VWA domain-containing protein n=1 Tax=Actinoallomurus purpureus TaxID=478114 RepID=UPI002092EC79|nr:VWA domain-containing protein [Actinoallomurus purpureus]MCO6008213.1 VWA domain-containing protein [Actinoallomurus purpureus]